VIRLVTYELVKTFLKKRTYLGFLIILLIVPLIEVAMKIEGEGMVRMWTRGLQQDFFFVGNLFNGWIVAYALMNSLWIHIPILISFVAGDMLAGEATSGTYRLILTRPVSRTGIFLSKYVATLLYTLLFVCFLALLSIGLGIALLGTGQLLVPLEGLLILPADDIAWRFFVAYILAFWSMTTIASIAFFFSSFVENAIGPIIATMGTLIIFTIIVFIQLEFFDPIRPYLFAQYMNLWQNAFTHPFSLESLQDGVLVQGLTSIVSVLGAWVIFVRKDILS
jgi:ABC-2 type transport system permease protein